MKKLALFFALSSISITSYSALPTGAGEFQVNAPIFNGNYEFGADALFVKNSVPDLDYVLSYPGLFPGGRLLRESGRLRSVRPGFTFGYQFYLGYLIPCTSNDVRLTYANYEVNETDRVGNREGLLQPSLGSTFPVPVSIPEITGTFLIDGLPFAGTILSPAATVFPQMTVIEADAKDTVRQGTVDLDAGQYINIDTFVRLRLFSGLRLTHIKNKLTANYIIGNFAAAQTNVIGTFLVPTNIITATIALSGVSQIQETISQSSNFNGIGPRFGVEAAFHLGGGWGLIGKLSSALLVGNQQTALSARVEGAVDLRLDSIVVTNLDPTVPVGVDPATIVPPLGTVFSTPTNFTESFSFDKDPRIVPNLEGKIGLNFSTQFKHCRTFTLEVGYFVNHYFNVIERLSATITSFSLENHQTMDASFSGPYIEAVLTI